MSRWWLAWATQFSPPKFSKTFAPPAVFSTVTTLVESPMMKFIGAADPPRLRKNAIASSALLFSKMPRTMKGIGTPFSDPSAVGTMFMVTPTFLSAAPSNRC